MTSPAFASLTLRIHSGASCPLTSYYSPRSFNHFFFFKLVLQVHPHPPPPLSEWFIYTLKITRSIKDLKRKKKIAFGILLHPRGLTEDLMNALLQEDISLPSSEFIFKWSGN